MSWESFWLPNILQATVFATLAAVVGALVRRWLKQVPEWLPPLVQQIFGEQEKTKIAAESAEAASKEAAAHATSANAQAKNAVQQSTTAAEQSTHAAQAAAATNETSRLNSRGLVDLKGRYDDLFGAYTSLLGLLRLSADDVNSDRGEVQVDVPEVDPALTTGRHRFRPRGAQPPDDGDHE